MKKTLFALAIVAITLSATAQEQRAGGLMAEFNYGVSSFSGFSALSLFEDKDNSHPIAPTAGFTIGYYNHNEKDAWTLTYSASALNTSHVELDETAAAHSLLLGGRDYFPVSGKVEIEAGAEVGLLMLRNRFTLPATGESHNESRYGFSGRIFAGVNYLLTRGYIGLKLYMSQIMRTSGDRPEVPTGMAGNQKQSIYGWGVVGCWGIRL